MKSARAGLAVLTLTSLSLGCASSSSELPTSNAMGIAPGTAVPKASQPAELKPARNIVRSSERVIDVVGEFYIPANEEWVFESDVIIRSTAPMVIDGVLRCEEPTSPDNPAPNITLVSYVGIVIRGEVRPTQGFDAVKPGQHGGDAGSLTIAAPIIVSRLPFEGARGGFGAPGGDGGNGGDIFFYGSGIGPFSQAPDTPLSEVRGGDGSIGGAGRYIEGYPEALRPGDGGDGGNAMGGRFVLADWDGPIPEDDNE